MVYKYKLLIKLENFKGQIEVLAGGGVFGAKQPYLKAEMDVLDKCVCLTFPGFIDMGAVMYSTIPKPISTNWLLCCSTLPGRLPKSTMPRFEQPTRVKTTRS
jgi:hypothetical protein